MKFNPRTFLQRRCHGVASSVLFACLVGACASPGAPVSSAAKAEDDIVWTSAEPLAVAPISSLSTPSQILPAASVSPPASANWKHRAFPGKKQTSYQLAMHDGRRAIRSDSTAAASMLRQAVRVEPADLAKISFSWKVPALIHAADLTQPDTSDSPVRLVLVFDGDRSRFSMKNAMVSEMAQTLTGEPLPYATLMYVWGTQHPSGSIIVSQRTDRIRKLVLESGPQRLGQWLDYERDIKADFEKAFGEAPGALIGVGIMTDTDNTRGHAQAWYGPVRLQPKTTGLDASWKASALPVPDITPLQP